MKGLANSLACVLSLALVMTGLSVSQAKASPMQSLEFQSFFRAIERPNQLYLSIDRPLPVSAKTAISSRDLLPNDFLGVAMPSHEIKADGANQINMDEQWFRCCGDSAILAMLDDSVRLAEPQRASHRRSGSMVAMAKIGSTVPLSFEVSRRVHIQTAPEPTSMLLLIGMGSAMLLKRKRRPLKQSPRIR